jgi:hypothetical protein
VYKLLSNRFSIMLFSCFSGRVMPHRRGTILTVGTAAVGYRLCRGLLFTLPTWQDSWIYHFRLESIGANPEPENAFKLSQGKFKNNLTHGTMMV